MAGRAISQEPAVARRRDLKVSRRLRLVLTGALVLAASAVGGTSASEAPTPLEELLRETIDGARERLSVELPDGSSVTFRRRAAAGVASAARLWHGSAPAAEMVLSGHGDLVSGTLFTPSGVLTLLPGASAWSGEAVDAEPCGGAPAPPPAAAGERRGELRRGAAAVGPIDVLVLYTPESRRVLGGRRNAEALIRHYVDVTNVAYRNSGVEVRLRLAHAAERAVPGDVLGSNERHLAWLRGDAAVAALRDTQGADVVGLLYERGSGFCGSAAMLFRPGRNGAGQAFFEMQRGCGALTFAHEIGHLQGADHDPENAISSRGDESFPYSLGHFHEGRYRTLMAYATACDDPCPEQPFFSTPRRRFDRLPAGVRDQRDNTRVLNQTAAAVVAFRPAAAAGCPLEKGDPDYCRECGPCGAGEGVCAGDAECDAGLSCEAERDGGVCRSRDACELAPGDPDYCRRCGPCAFGEGDCDRDGECAAGLTCLDDVGPSFALAPSVDVCAHRPGGYCPLPLGHPDYCRACGPCELGEGSCRSSNDCAGAVLECYRGAGARFGFAAGAGVCLFRAGGGECPFAPGHPDYCRACGLCDAGEGDCDGDRECRRGLSCVDGAGAAVGLAAEVDVCVARGPAPALAAPRRLRAELLPSGAVRLRWRDTNDGAAGFRIQARRGDGRFRKAGRAPRGATEKVLDSLQPGSRYTFRVRAKRGREKSDFSNEVVVTTPPA